MSNLDPTGATTSIGGQSVMAIAQGQLDAGEKLVWASRAGRSAAAWTRAGPALFGAPFLAFVLFWIGTTWWAVHQATEEGPVFFFPFFALPFLLLGLAFLLSPFWAAWRAGYMVYAITSERLMIISLQPWLAVTSFAPGDMDTIEYTERADRSGNVVFRHPLIPQYYGMGAWRFGRSSNLTTAPIGFYGVPEARRVAEAVRALKSRAAGPARPPTAGN